MVTATDIVKLAVRIELDHIGEFSASPKPINQAVPANMGESRYGNGRTLLAVQELNRAMRDSQFGEEIIRELAELAKSGNLGSLAALTALRYVSILKSETGRDALITIARNRSHRHRRMAIHHLEYHAQSDRKAFDVLVEIAWNLGDPDRQAAIESLRYVSWCRERSFLSAQADSVLQHIHA